MNIIDKLNEQGYSEQASLLWEKMRAKELDSIVIATKKAKESRFSMGESKIGGMPHLPKDFVWPQFNGKPLAFLAQINLAEITKYDKARLLPARGILYFFHEGGEEVWGFDPKDKGGFCVKYHAGSPDDLAATEFPQTLDDYSRFPPCKLKFAQKKSYPSWEDCNASDFPYIHQGKSDYCEPILDVFLDGDEDEDDGGFHKLLGYPDLVQGDIFLEAQLVTNGLYCGDETGYNDPRAAELEKNVSEWMLLFQIDSDDNADMMWGDCGRIYFTIKKSDLKNLNFDAVWSSFQCS